MGETEKRAEQMSRKGVRYSEADKVAEKRCRKGARYREAEKEAEKGSREGARYSIQTTYCKFALVAQQHCFPVLSDRLSSSQSSLESTESHYFKA